MEGQGHWRGIKANPHDYLGFIYEIVDLTCGRKYVGRKQYWLVKNGTRKGCKNLVSDKRSDRWKPSCWVESDWRSYKGSSPSFTKWMKKFPDHEYSFNIVRQCYNKSELHYAEVEELVMRGALWKRINNLGSTDGVADSDYEYFNRQIPATKFRVKTWEELLESEEKQKNRE